MDGRDHPDPDPEVGPCRPQGRDLDPRVMTLTLGQRSKLLPSSTQARVGKTTLQTTTVHVLIFACYILYK